MNQQIQSTSPLGVVAVKLCLRDKSIAAITLCVFLIYLALGIFHHEAWRDEWQAINIARAATSLPDLYERLRYEGHPALWYMLIRAVWEIYPSLLAVQILNSTFALAAAGLIVFLTPWPLWLRLMVAFTGPAAWEYSIKARSYGLGWLLIVCLSFVLGRTNDRQKPWIITSLAILALNTSIVTGLLAFSLVAGWLWEEFRAKRLCLAILPITMLVVATVGTYILALPPPDAIIRFTPHGIVFSDIGTQIKLFTTTLLPNTALDRAQFPAVFISATLAAFICFKVLCTNQGARVALACGWLSINMFFLLNHPGYSWHHWHLFLTPIAVAIAFERETAIPRSSIAVLSVLAILGLNCGVRNYIRDWAGIYSAAKPAAEAIKAAGLERLPIVVFPNPSIASLSGYLGHPLNDSSCSGEYTYPVWRKNPMRNYFSLDCSIQLAAANSEHMSLIAFFKPFDNKEQIAMILPPTARLHFMGSYLVDTRLGANESFYIYILKL